jgi:hypothetical protein
MTLREENVVGNLTVAVGDAIGLSRDEAGTQGRGKVRQAIESTLSQLEPEPTKLESESLSDFITSLWWMCIKRRQGTLNEIEDAIALRLNKKVRHHKPFTPLPILAGVGPSTNRKTYVLKRSQ